MNKDEKFVITINRELGSGGRTVGEKLAAKLGVPFYDKALIKALQKKYNLTVEEIERLKGRSHSWWADFKRVLSIGEGMKDVHYYQVSIGDEPDILTTDEMYKAEKEILKSIAEEESCVIAGRTGFHILRSCPNHLSILIQASMEHRINRVMSKNPELSKKDVEKIIKKIDKMRENYVTKYCGVSRYDTRNYDLVVNMDGKTEEEVADLICTYIG